jgi:long-chain fatty acid transport protein
MSAMPRIHNSTFAKHVLGCSLAVLVSQQASAVGFIVNPTSENTGIANAGSAVYDRSVAAISNNPAAMSLIPHKQVGGNLSLVIPDWPVNENWDCREEDNCANSNIGNVLAIPALGLIRPMDHNFTWGIGLSAIAGQGVDYGDDWKGRAIIRDNSLSVLGLMNSISWRMNEKWTFGVGLGIIYGEMHQKQDLPSLSASAGDDLESVVQFVGLAQDCRGLPPPLLAICLNNAVNDSGLDPESAIETISSIRSYLDGEPGTKIKLEGDDLGAEIALGTTYEFIPGHRLGLVYRYTSNFSFEGDATINGQLLSDEPMQKQHMTLDWNMPDRLIVSGSHQVGNDLKLYWDFERVFFDTFERTDLRIDGYPTVQIDRNFKDANRYAIGAEYALDHKLTLQFGLSYDESPVDDEDRMPDIPVDEIVKTMVGAIYQRNDRLHLHGYAAVEFFGDNKIEQLASIHGKKIGDTVNLDSDAVLYVLGLSFGYKF